MDIYIYVSIQTSLVRFQRQAVVKDRPDGYVEEYLVAAEDKHHLEEHDGGGPEQAPAETRRMGRREAQCRVVIQYNAPHDQEEEAEPPARREAVDEGVALGALVVVGVGQPSERDELSPAPWR